MVIRVGIVGFHPKRDWGMAAHVPALRTLADPYELAGVTASRKRTCLGDL
jgi:hypothetical protein